MLIFRLALDSQKRCLQSQMKFLAQATWMLLPQQTRRQADTRIRLKTLLGHVYVNGKNLSWKKSPCKQYKPSQRRLGCPLPFTKTPWRNIKTFRHLQGSDWGFTMVVYEKIYIFESIQTIHLTQILNCKIIGESRPVLNFFQLTYRFSAVHVTWSRPTSCSVGKSVNIRVILRYSGKILT